MKKTSKILAVYAIILLTTIGSLYYSFCTIDFIGHKDPKVIAANNERQEKMLLEAEYKEFTDRCNLKLLDSVEAEISIWDSYGGTIDYTGYTINNDTLILDNISSFKKTLNSKKMIIKEDRILYRKYDNSDIFDTTKTLTIKFNKL